MPEVSVFATKPVDLIVMECAEVRVLRAEWVARDEHYVSLRLVDPPAPGTTVGISGPDIPNWVHGKVTKVEGDVIQVAVRGEMPADRRDFSRTYGGIDLRYQVVNPAEFELTSQRWITLAESNNALWFKPDPFMDFSASGLNFHDIERCAPGDRLLVEFKIPGSPITHRATAVVIRLHDIPTEEMDDHSFETGGIIPSCRVVAQFIRLGPISIMALIQFSDKIREAAVF